MFIDRNADRSADRTSRNYGNAMKLSVNRQAVEADAGETLAGRLLLIDLWQGTFRTVKIAKAEE